ncbi:MAG: DDE-type integrase/transposase/recombinase [Chlorobiaceae bacterium]
MDKQQAEKVAIFRYGLIAPIIHEQGQRQMAYFRDVATRTIQNPMSKTVSYSVSTLKGWLREYRQGGINALYPSTRKDAGISKKIDPVVSAAIKTMIDTLPGISASALYRALVKQGTIDKTMFTEVTLRNYIRRNDLRTPALSSVGRRKFEMPAINMLWTMDFLHGPHVRDCADHNRKKKVYLCAIIDDHSRLIVGAQFAFAENSFALATVIKSAILQYGLPQKLYCDNGAAFSTGYLQLACARTGIALLHSKPYDSPSRGKIERFFRTVRQMFLSVLVPEALTSLDAMNTCFKAWLDEYHLTIHSGTDQAPKARFMKSLDHQSIRRIAEHELDQSFYYSVERHVKKDSTVSINRCLFEVPPAYIGQKVELRSPLDHASALTLFIDGKPICAINPVNLIENSQKPYTGIHFSKEDESHDTDSL